MRAQCLVCKAMHRHSNKDPSTEKLISIILNMPWAMCKMATMCTLLLPRSIPVDIHKSGKLRKNFRWPNSWHRPVNLRLSTVVTISGLQINSFTSLPIVQLIPYSKRTSNKFLLVAMSLLSMANYRHNNSNSSSLSSHSRFSTHLDIITTKPGNLS